MILKNKKIIVLAVFGAFLLNAQVLAAPNRNNNKEEVILPVQLKPERLELLNRIADENLMTDDYPYKSVKEVEEIVDRIKIEEKILSGNTSQNIEKLYSTISVDMLPSDNFKTINLVPNYSTTLIFLDKLGNPWSIKKFIVGGAADYSPEQQSENIITFSPIAKVSDSNLTVILEDGKPISFNLVIGDKKVDFITEIKIDGYGNNSPKEESFNFINTKSNTNDLLYLSKSEEKFMSEMLSNNLPEGFYDLTVLSSTGLLKDDYRIFHKKGDKFLYVRTIHSIYSPRIVKQRNGVDGKTKVMKIPYTTSMYATEFSKLEKLKIKI